MESKIEYGDIIYKFTNKNFIIMEILVDNCPCYCIYNLKTGKKAIFDHEDRILDGVKNLGRINDDWSVMYNERRDRSLQAYLFFLYHGIVVSEFCHYTKLKDKNMKKIGITDLRKENIVPTNIYTPNTICVWPRPNNPEEKYIAVTSKGITEIFNYSDSILKLFQERINLVTPETDKKYKRLRFRKTKTNKSIALSRFILQKYEGNIPDTSHCGHIHSGYRWINCPENIMEMNGKTNDLMSDFASRIVNGYNMNAVVYRDGRIEKILVEFGVHGIHGYVVCNTPELYLSFQNFILGRLPITKRLKLFFNQVRVDTPAQAFARHGIKNNHLDNKEKELWGWCASRDRILATYMQYPERFIEWKQGDKKGVAMGILMEAIAKYRGTPTEIFWRIIPSEINAE